MAELRRTIEWSKNYALRRRLRLASELKSPLNGNSRPPHRRLVLVNDT